MNLLNWIIKTFVGILSIALSCAVLGLVARVMIEAAKLGWNIF